MSVVFSVSEASPVRRSSSFIPLDFLVTAFVAVGGMTFSTAALTLSGYDWLTAVQLGVF